MVKLHSFNGCEMYLNDEYITHRFILDNGLNYEPHVRAQIERFIPKTNVMWDIGSNAGVHTVSAKQVNPSLAVVCFEPMQQNRECLLRTIRHNHWDDVMVVPCAVGDVNGVIGINDCPDDPVCGENDTNHPFLTPCMTLDSFSLPLPQFTKIDIEGFEHRALRHARLLLKFCQVIVSEFNERLLRDNGKPVDYIQFLIDCGYSVSLISPGLDHIHVTDAALAAQYVTENLNDICDLLCINTKT